MYRRGVWRLTDPVLGEDIGRFECVAASLEAATHYIMSQSPQTILLEETIIQPNEWHIMVTEHISDYYGSVIRTYAIMELPVYDKQ